MMDRRRPVPTLPTLALAAAALAGGAPAAGDFAEGQLVVGLDQADAIDEINSAFGTSVIGSIPELGAFLLELPPQAGEEVLLAMLESADHVEWAELNYLTQAFDGQTQSFFASIAGGGEYEQQYAWSTLDLASAHAITRGASVVVALLDTGVDAAHPALAGSILAGGYDFVDDDGIPEDAANGVDDDGDGVADELLGHGTFLAALVAAVAPEAGILPVRVLEADGQTDAFTVAEGVLHAAGGGADVINLSMTSEEPSLVVTLAIDEARAAGAVVVAAAGNADDGAPRYPAAEAAALAVGATDANDLKADFSNYGEHLALCAPGVEIVGALPDGAYGLGEGTSLSTAIVAGVTALVRSAEPQAAPAEVEAQLLAAADPLDGSNPDYAGLLGSGRADALAAVGEGLPGPVGGLEAAIIDAATILAGGPPRGAGALRALAGDLAAE